MYPEDANRERVKWFPLSAAKEYLYGSGHAPHKVHRALGTGTEGGGPDESNGHSNGDGAGAALSLAANGEWAGSEEFEQWARPELPLELCTAVYSCASGTPRSYVLDAREEGALLQELFTPDGVGCMVSRDLYEGIRFARPSDMKEIKALLKPLEENGTLKERSEDELASELRRFAVMQRDQEIIACAALRYFGSELVAEIAALVVHQQCRGQGRGDSLLQYLEQLSVRDGMKRIFILTTRTAEWFVQRAFVPQGDAHESSVLPEERFHEIDPSRKAQLYVKDLFDRG
jgi:amino-acid N-acetyltransferase